MKSPKFQIIPSKITDPQEAERLRGMKAGQCFRHLLDAAKGQIDYAQGYAHGRGCFAGLGSRHRSSVLSDMATAPGCPKAFRTDGD
jgi:hypothetical protein